LYNFNLRTFANLAAKKDERDKLRLRCDTNSVTNMHNVLHLYYD